MTETSTPILTQSPSNGMSRADFWSFARDLAIYYGSEKHATPTNAGSEQLKVWYVQVKSMPSEPLPWIADQIKATNDFMPKNLPKIMWALWYKWQDQYPKKEAEKSNRENCDCHDGVNIVKQGGTWVAVRCLKCMPALPDNFLRADIGGKKKYGIMQSTYTQLKSEGYKIKNDNFCNN